MIKRIKINWIVVLVVLLIAAAVVVVAGRLSLPSAHAQVSAQATKDCIIWNIAVFPDRVHVLCTTVTVDGAANIWYFAYPTSDSAGASRFLSMFETARAVGSHLTIYFNAGDHTGTVFGCQAADCRKITGVSIP